MTAREILVAARAKIEKPENWTRAELARNEAGAPTGPTAPDASSWCMYGALRAIGQECSNAYDILSWCSGEWGLTFFNDTHEHVDVLAVYDAAIAAAGEQP